MKCNYFEYRELANKLFYGVALTDVHLNETTEIIRQYLVNGGAGETMKSLNIGIKVVTRESLLIGSEIVKRRFIWLGGERKGEELTADEICGIGMFLKNGPFYGFQKQSN